MCEKQLPLLIDFDGVLRIGKHPANYLKEFFEFINNTKIPACIISNSTLTDGKSILKFFKKNSIVCNLPVLTAADATASYVKKKYKKIAVYCADSIKALFEDMIDFNFPEAVVVGDIGKRWNYEIMNEIFNFIINGADFIAMHKNKFWKTREEGLLLDAGTFINGIEYASGKNAVLIGKPSPFYFQAGLEVLGFSENLITENKQEFLMLGDDLETDIMGAKKMGAKTILIYTGKTSYPLPENSPIIPHFESKDLMNVISLLKNIYEE